MARKVCTVRAEHRGSSRTVTVTAASLYEAAALGYEQLCREGFPGKVLEVTVWEPRGRYAVRPGQLVSWLRQHVPDENLAALKRRVQELLQRAPR